MCRRACRWGGVWVLLVCGGLLLRADEENAFLSLRLETQGGYDSNPSKAPSAARGSPLLLAAPGADITLIGETSEASLLFDYRRTEYTRDDTDATETAATYARWRRFRGVDDYGGTFGGGLCRDDLEPANDNTFIDARPYFAHSLTSVPAEIELGGNVRHVMYRRADSTTGLTQADTRIALGPGVRWHISRGATLFGEVTAERNISNTLEAEYVGLGAAIGGRLEPTPCTAVGLVAGGGFRPYDEAPDREDRRDTPLNGELWVTWRCRPWMEFVATLDVSSLDSTVDSEDYTSWRASLGARLILEHSLAWR